MKVLACKHFQTSYCKFQERCRKQQIKNLCETEIGKSKTCDYRHTQNCRFFTAHDTCKFGEHSAYQQNSTKSYIELNMLLNEIYSLENTVNLPSEKSVIFEEKL